MTDYQVLFSLEADSLDAAQAAVAAWTITPGAVLSSLHGMEQSEGLPVTVGEDGSVAAAMTAAADTDHDASD